MKISLHVKPRSKEEHVERSADGSYVVRVKEPPVEGRANDAVRRALARHFGVAPSRVRVLRGHKGRRKVAEIQA
ncbi:MAG: DUF167 domain-containing protein [Acidobacteriota bacterium]|nr:MAG: DUF167 domain-containing protein [Acidobacteriota bacterium]